MDKKTIIKNINEAVAHDPHKDAINSILLFGSYAKDVAHENSDIDLIIDFDPNKHIGFFTLAQIKRNLQDYTHTNVDLLTKDSVSDILKDSVFTHTEKIYEKR